MGTGANFRDNQSVPSDRDVTQKSLPSPFSRVLLVGWDAADWNLIHPLLDAGRLPTLARLVAAGAMGDCVSVTPSIAPLTWTSVATGLRADRHGILSDREPDPVSGDWRRTSCRGRTAKALWNIATQSGLRSVVVNWAASHPAEPILGLSVDERITSVAAPLGVEWPMPEGCVYPADRAASLAELRLHPRELPASELLPFIPGIAGIDASKDPRPGLVADGLAATVTVHAIVTELLEHEAWDFAAIRYHLLEPLSQVFMRYRAPLLDGIPEQDVAAYGGVIDAGYALLDAMLARLIELAGPDTVVILVSDHGFQSGAGRPKPSVVGTNPLTWHRPLGIVAIAGPGVRPDQLIHGAGLLDIAPTVLALLGLPIGGDMPGRILAEAFVERLKAERIPSWETVDGECGRHPPDSIEDPWQARDAIRQLVALGYSETSPAEEAQLAAAAAGQDLHRAFAHFEARNLDEAIASLRRVIAATPRNLQAILLLASSLLAKGELQECRALAEQVAADPRLAPYASLLLGMLETSEGNTDEAIAHFAEAEKQGGTSSYLLGNVAWAHLLAKRLDEAARLFHAVRDLEPDSPLASIGLAIVHAEQGKPAESVDEALNAIGRRYFWPEAHAQLGIALVRLGQIERAIQAFETSLAQRPTALAHGWLAMIHERVTGDTAKATTHRRLALAIRGGAKGTTR